MVTRPGTLRIGCGAGFSGDRIEPAIELATEGDLDYLVFECLAERTIALAQQARKADSEAGFDPLLEERMIAVLPACRARGTRIVTNMGAANPQAAARRVRAVAEQLRLAPIRIAVVTGDDVLALIGEGAFDRLAGEPVVATDSIVSANAYLGAAPIVEALARGADVVLTGRVADPSLFVAPLIVHHRWDARDWPRLGAGTLVGHLLECAGQVTGGYFADPGCKDVADLARLGFPLAEVAADGTAVITKVPGSGGQVTRATCTEQLLYEIHDPAAYVTPDVVADFSDVVFREAGGDRIAVSGATGRAAPANLKVSVGYLDGWIGDGQISYAGPGALERAQLALALVRERLHLTGVPVDELRCDLIGVDALHGRQLSRAAAAPYEVRVRVAARTSSATHARRVTREVEALYTNGPAGGGGATTSVRQGFGVTSVLVPRERVRWQVDMLEVG